MSTDALGGSIGSAFVDIRLSMDKIGKDLSGLEAELKKKLGGTVPALDNTKNAFTGLLGAVRTAFGALGAAFGARAFVQFVGNAIATADAVGESARAANIGAERFQRLSYVFGQAGVQAETFGGAMRVLNTRFGQFLTTGSGAAADAIEALGLKTRIMNGEIQTSEQFLDAVIVAFGSVDGAARQAAIAAALFGREAGPRMAATLAQGSASINQQASQIRALTDLEISKADALSDAWDRLAGSFGNFAKGAAISGTFSLSRLFGIDEASGGVRSLEIQLGELKAQRDLVARQRAAGLGTVQNTEDLDKQIALVEQQIEYEKLLRTPFVTTGGGKEAADELQEIVVANHDLMRKAPNPWADDPRLQEIKLPKPIKMPSDWKSFGPVMLEWEKINKASEDYEKNLEIAKAKQMELSVAIAASFESRGWQALTEGKASDAIQGFIKDLAELIVRITVLQPLAAALSASLSSIGGVGGFFTGVFSKIAGKAKGGPVSAGETVVVGEEGPELFRAGVSGSVIPNHKLFSGARGISADANGHMPAIEQNFNFPLAFPAQLEAFVRNVAGPAGRDAALSVIGARGGNRI
jgi:hypothetical protein